MSPGEVDLLELRVDGFEGRTELLKGAAKRLPAPLLLTVRHPGEGGMASWNLAARREMFRQFLPLVDWMDVEVRSLKAMQAEIALGKSMGVRLIVSDHHFKGLPAMGRLRGRSELAWRAGAEVFKVAATLLSAAELEKMLGFLNRGRPGTLSVMGMGPLGQVSRLLFGKCGSVFNYGYLDRAQVSGQWEAVLLKQRLAELL